MGQAPTTEGVSQGKELQSLLQLFENAGKLGGPVSELWTDALHLLLDALPTKRMREERRQRILRSSVLMASAASEAFVNYLAGKVVEAEDIRGARLTEFERDCLRGKRRRLEKGEVREERQLLSTKERCLLLLRLLKADRDHLQRETGLLEKSIEVRDKIVHPKPGTSVSVDHEAVVGFFRVAMLLSAAWGGKEFGPASSRSDYERLLAGLDVSPRTTVH